MLTVRSHGMHSYHDGHIGTTLAEKPLFRGHESFSVVEAIGPKSLESHSEYLQPGTRVAVDSTQPCGRCRLRRTVG